MYFLKDQEYPFWTVKKLSAFVLYIGLSELSIYSTDDRGIWTKTPGLTLPTCADPHLLHVFLPARRWYVAGTQTQLPFPRETLAGINQDP